MRGLLIALDAAPSSLTILDIVLLLVVLYSCVRGFFQGLISELGLLLALIVGTVIAGQFAAEVGAPLARFGMNARLRAACGYVIVLAIVWIATRVVTGVLRGGAKVLMLGWVDHLAGAAFGLLRGIVVVIVVSFVIVHFRIGSLSTVAHDSVLVHAAGPIFPALNSLLAAHLQVGPTIP